MKVEVHAVQRFRVPAPRKKVFELLADIPETHKHFPNVKRVVSLGNGGYRFEMETVHLAGVTHQVVYGCRYTTDAKGGTIHWKPVKDVGNGVIEGRWTLESESGGTHLEFTTHGVLNVEVPLLLRPMASPFVQGQFRSEVSRFLDNLRRVLS